MILIGELGVELHEVDALDDDDPRYQFCNPPEAVQPFVWLVANRFMGKLPPQVLVVRQGRDAMSK